MARIVRGLFYVIFVVFGGLSGYSTALYSQKYFEETLRGPALYANQAALILLGILLGATIAPWLANLMVSAVEHGALALQKIPLQQVIMGLVGLVFGLILALLVNLFIAQINFGSVPVVGPFLYPLILILTTIFLASFGTYVASRVSFVHGFKQLLETGSAGRWGGTILLDTSVIVDGRIADIIATGFVDGTLVVPQFVLDELHQLADSEDPLKRNRGRRGLDVLASLRKTAGIHIERRDYDEPGVDTKLIRMALELKARICTTDYNLNKVASLQNIRVLNINELSNALKPIVLPGEVLVVKILREGKESGQGVGYLDDGTMVVVEDGRRHLRETVLAEVTSVVQTPAGRMFFARYRGSAEGLPGPSSDTNGGHGQKQRPRGEVPAPEERSR